jgi:hypothetical protein
MPLMSNQDYYIENSLIQSRDADEYRPASETDASVVKLPVSQHFEPAPRYLPDEFWNALPSLRHIKQAALARSVSPDALLHSVLARIAAYGPHGLVLPPIVGHAAALNYYVAVSGPPSAGKSVIQGVADDLLPDPEWNECAHRSISSGQGIAAAYIEPRAPADPNDKRKSVPTQVRNNALVHVDEGETLNKLMGQRDSILGSELRAAWTGQAFGTNGVRAETNRRVPALSYRLGLVANFQPVHAAPLFADVDSGLPQRFVWAPAIYPWLTADCPDWPGELPWTPAPLQDGEIFVPAWLVELIRADRLARATGQVEEDPMQAHGNLLRLKMAALLAQLDGRSSIDQDWQLAGMMLDCSNAVRADVQSQARAAQLDAEHETNSALGRRAVAIDGMKAEAPLKVAQYADQLVERAATGPFQWSGRDGERNCKRATARGLWKQAVAQAVNAGRLEQFSKDEQIWLRLPSEQETPQ